ncbi:2-amino-4-hydroxy-6-hydroxymethyldihydropteridine diphosphokinase [Crateriforma spongiae]|uniref:2-amino-4-hydroxy-6- hydroxymethyldihydropteridine diphosphokinase n=1 Tax=Crateriforma spongiae TaxID=2724528 RepID=UPI001447B5BB|nr:2-amino-4-hydroxy-6-hydroxymethyldihydropteridine diphosphokinase [Crateriforma spongiae]
MSQCLISLGSNLGQRSELLHRAAERVAKSSVVSNFRASRLYETPPIGGPGGQEPFLNAAAAFDTESSAHEILSLLQEVEQWLGRQRLRRWDARSIDLDVVLYGDLVGGDSHLVVPHPRYPARTFVLHPACDVADHYRDPRFGWTIGELSRHVAKAQPSLCLVGGDADLRKLICRRLTEDHGVTTFQSSDRVMTTGTIANAPLPPSQIRFAESPVQDGVSTADAAMPAGPWVSDSLPSLDITDRTHWDDPRMPRLIARIQHVTEDSSWPAPHKIWPKGWRYPEYRLEVTDVEWAIGEVASALDSMRCPCRAVTADGSWWR